MDLSGLRIKKDIEELRHLLKNITNLGKKKSIGGGLIRDITINGNAGL